MGAQALHIHTVNTKREDRKREGGGGLQGNTALCQSMREENRAGRGSGGTETVCREELLASSHSVISMGDSLSVSGCVSTSSYSEQRDMGQSSPRCCHQPDTAELQDMQRENFEETSELLVRIG